MSTESDTVPMLGSANTTGPYFNVTFEEFDYYDTYSGCHQMAHPHEDFTQIPAVLTIIVLFYIIVAVMAVLGNTLVIWTVWRNSHMHTVTNYYIVNLAISDFLVASLVMPLKLLEWTADCSWQVFRTDALCAVINYLLPIFVFTSVLTLVFISIERYYAIVHPLSAMKINSKSRTRRIIALTWIIPIVVASPYVFCKTYAFTITSQYGTISRQICNDRFDEIDIAIYGPDPSKQGSFRRGYFAFIFCVIYLIPSIVILTTCIKIAISLLQPITVENSVMRRKDKGKGHEENKRKVARMVVVIAITFIVSWSPMYIVTIISQLQTNSFLREGNFLFIMLMTHLCGFINSCLNPIIYTAMSHRFRRSFKEIMSKIFCCCVRGSSIPSRFLFRHVSSNRTRFTSTLRQTFSETEGNTIALNDCMHENSYMIRKSGSKSSSSGTDSERFVCSRDTKPKKFVNAFKGKYVDDNTATSDSETHKPLIPHAYTNGKPARELKGILKSSPTVRRARDYSTYVECKCLCSESPPNGVGPQCMKMARPSSDDSINQNSVCFLRDDSLNVRAKYSNRV